MLVGVLNLGGGLFLSEVLVLTPIFASSGGIACSDPVPSLELLDSSVVSSSFSISGLDSFFLFRGEDSAFILCFSFGVGVTTVTPAGLAVMNPADGTSPKVSAITSFSGRCRRGCLRVRFHE